jgi:hypothetical protein
MRCSINRLVLFQKLFLKMKHKRGVFSFADISDQLIIIIFSLFINFLLIILLISCQEVYVNENLEASKKIPVVEGLITNSIGPYQIILYYAQPYNANKRIPISAATIYTNDDKGNTFKFYEKSAGVYKSDSGQFNSIIGKSYTLYIDMQDGTKLRSDPELLRDTLSIHKIIKQRETKEEYYRSYDNQILTKKITGQAYYLVMDSTYKEKAFFRIYSSYNMLSFYSGSGRTTKEVEINGQIHVVNIRVDTNITCAKSFSDNDVPNIGYFSPDKNQSEVSRIQYSYFISGYEKYSIPGYQNLDSSLFITLFKISEKTYNYYKSIKEQLNATTRLFDPLPTQLTGNMHCISDSNQVVLGFFELSSYSIRKTRPFQYDMGCYTTIYEYE